jgi:hypothetical protein
MPGPIPWGSLAPREEDHHDDDDDHESDDPDPTEPCSKHVPPLPRGPYIASLGSPQTSP